ncbi:MAG: TonB-dependent receptor [Gammaproteobacteria bacterium]|nr:TonB-dependent receptor [Gammaproteobacteria bacterium]
MILSSNNSKDRNSIARRHSDITLAVRRALVMSAVVAAGAGAVSLPAYAQEQEASPDAIPTQTVTVTGSRIRRVDAETASPVYTIDQSAIMASGKTTVGELVMQLPSVNGSATNPSTNNGGGFGESYIELRGLDAKRTVILIDGRRVGLIGDPGSGTSAVDVNQIPLAIIDHVEVLKEGAGAIYGSDAIAGVVNFITRKDLTGLEVTADYGRTTANDGAHHQVQVSMGEQGDKFGFMLSGRYQKQDAVSEGRRDWSKFALYDYSGTASAAGSSRTPTGRINVPTGGFPGGAFANCGSASVTKVAGAAGNSLADFRCFNSGGAADDHYNFAPINLLETPQERGSIFSKVNYKINDMVEAYGSVLYNRTRSGFQEAALPFDATSDNVVISKDSVYNPFGIDFGGVSGVNPDAKFRLLGLGPRFSDATSTSVVTNFGVKGNLFDTGWNWDLYSQYGRIDQQAKISGYFFSSSLSQALGPSFFDSAGVATCGTAAQPVANCTPINIFAVNDLAVSSPAQQAAFKSISTGYNTDHSYRTRSFALDLNGKVLTLPAGDMQASVGAEYRWQEGIFTADQIVQGLPPLFVTCEISAETCTGDSRLHYSNTDLYGELFVPILKDMPLAKSLNIDFGVRYSKYTLFSATTKGQIKLEYRPISDLLIRGTFAQIYRAPTVQDLAQAAAASSTSYVDPCNGLTAALVAANPGLSKACVGVPTDGSFHEQDAQISGVLRSNPNLKPEQGEVTTYGIVYDPSFLPGFSTTVDFWHYTINDVLTQLDPTFASAQCIATGSPTYCDLAIRYGAGANAGQILAYLQPTENVGTLKTDGVDLGVKYSVRSTPIGSFRFSADVTHVNSFTNSPGGGFPTVEYAGTFSKQYGNDMKWRGLLSVAWGFHGFETLVTEQWLGKLTIPGGQPNAAPPVSTDIAIPNIYYTNFSVGYNFPTNTHVQAGVDNAFNRIPPLFYMNNVINANTDVATYDVLGRRWYVSFLQKL